jgi:hypothetical protein
MRASCFLSKVQTSLEGMVLSELHSRRIIVRSGHARYALVVLACIVATGCSYMTQPLSGGPGTLALTAPGSTNPTTIIAPNGSPAGQQPVVPPSNPNSTNPIAPAPVAYGLPPSGIYEGTGRNLTNPGGRCAASMNVRNFNVSGNQVSFGVFRGTVQPDGGLRMQVGHFFIIGEFRGGHFQGRLWQPQPSCTYTLSLYLVS